MWTWNTLLEARVKCNHRSCRTWTCFLLSRGEAKKSRSHLLWGIISRRRSKDITVEGHIHRRPNFPNKRTCRSSIAEHSNYQDTCKDRQAIRQGGWARCKGVRTHHFSACECSLTFRQGSSALIHVMSSPEYVGNILTFPGISGIFSSPEFDHLETRSYSNSELNRKDLFDWVYPDFSCVQKICTWILVK